MRGHLRKGIFAVICTLVSFVFVAPASAGKLWNPDTRQWDIFPDTPAVASNSARRKFKRKLITYRTDEKPGTIIIDTDERYLYHVQENGKAMRYGIGVGRDGFEWNGTERVTRKAKWPGWTPPEEMRRREAKKGRILPAYMKGGPDNPLGLVHCIWVLPSIVSTVRRRTGVLVVRSPPVVSACSTKTSPICMSRWTLVPKWS